MDKTKQIQSLFREAVVYHTQGLFDEARQKYMEVLGLVRGFRGLRNRDHLVGMITKKLNEVANEARRFENPAAAPVMTETEQTVVRESLFVAADKKTDAHAFDVAVALLGFGQFERALEAFYELLERGALRVQAAKNIIRCHLSAASLERAVSEYEKWRDTGLFEPGEIEKIRVFLEAILRKKRATGELSRVAAGPGAVPEGVDETASLDIISILIRFHDGPQKGIDFSFDVASQTDDMVSIIVPGEEDGLLNYVEVGHRLEDVQFFSPLAVLRSAGVLCSKTRINSGPREGSYSLVLRILET